MNSKTGGKKSAPSSFPHLGFEKCCAYVCFAFSTRLFQTSYVLIKSILNKWDSTFKPKVRLQNWLEQCRVHADGLDVSTVCMLMGLLVSY